MVAGQEAGFRPDPSGGTVAMRTPDEVTRMEALARRGWGPAKIAGELGVSKNTVRRYLRQGGWQPYQRAPRAGILDAHRAWLEAALTQHGGNADVVRQELAREFGIVVSLRTVERAVKPFRDALTAAARATVRFETPPGLQLQIDFGERWVQIAGVRTKVYVFVATLGYSRRCVALAFQTTQQSAWFAGIEHAFLTFGGVPQELLLDNAGPLVVKHQTKPKLVTYHPRFLAFCQHWGVRPVACAPYRARTKGKDERGVGYVKANALAGRTFASWAALEAHLAAWCRDIADQRVHGTTGEVPAIRFARDEAAALQPLRDRPSYQPTREWWRIVQADCCIELHRNWYSVPWRLIGETVRVVVHGATLTCYRGSEAVATHAVLDGVRQRATDPAHYAGCSPRTRDAAAPSPSPSSLLRPLAEYAALVDGEAA